MAQQCNVDGCSNAVITEIANAIFCSEHLEHKNRPSPKGGSIRPDEINIWPKGKAPHELAKKRSTSHWYDFDEDHWLWKKEDVPDDIPWGFIIMGFVGAPICAMGGGFGVFVGGCSLAVAIYGTAKKLLK